MMARKTSAALFGKPMVWPSFAAFTTTSVPSAPPAPGRLIGTIGTFSSRERPSPIGRAPAVGDDVVRVLVESGVDCVAGEVLGVVIVLSLLRRQIGRHHFAAAVERSGDDVRAFLEREADERFHYRDDAVGAVLETLP